MASPEQYDEHAPGDHPKVFVSYTHDSEQHREDVLAFAGFLMIQGIDVVLDRWATGRRQDWQAWATKHITESDYVLVIASEGYRRMGDGLGPAERNLGGQAEAALLRDKLQGDRARWTEKLLPVLLPGHDKTEIPDFLQPNAADRYEVAANTTAGAEDLLRVLTGQPRDVPPPLGPRPSLPPRGAAPAPRRTVLSEELPVTWRSEMFPQGHRPQGPLVELHLVPAEPPARYGVLHLERIAGDLAAAGRSGKLFSQAQSVTADSSADAVWAVSNDRRTGERGLAVLRGGQRTCWFRLPDATIGWILDREDLALEVAGRMALLLRIGLPLPQTFAPAIALDPVTSMTRLGRLAEASAASAQFNTGLPERIRVGADEALPTEDLRRSPHEIAEELVARLAAPLKRRS